MNRLLIAIALFALCFTARAQQVTLVSGADQSRFSVASSVFLVKTNPVTGVKLYSLYVWNLTNSAHYLLLFDTNATPGTAAVPSFPAIYLPPLTNTLLSLPAGRNFRNGLVICTSVDPLLLTNSSPVSIDASFYDKAF